jgi:hypothetical protein
MQIQNVNLVEELKQGMISRNSRLLVIVPTYNEIENIQRLI